MGGARALDVGAQYADFLFQGLSAALAGQTREDVYAVSCWIEEDHPEGPVLQVSCNTLGQVEKDFALGHDRAESTWNYACWLQENVGLVGHDTLLREAWLRELGTYYPEEALATADDDEFDRLMELKTRTYAEFFSLVASVVRRLHAEGVLIAHFGREIPVVVHDLDYSPTARDATREANSPELVAERPGWWT